VAVGDLEETGFPAPYRDPLGAMKRLDEGLFAAVREAEGASLERYNLSGIGYEPTRQAWAALFAEEAGVSYDPAAAAGQVFVTHGGMQAIFHTLIATARHLGWSSKVRPGQRPSLFVPTPYFPCVTTQAALLGLDLRPWDCTPEDAFLPNADAIRRARPQADCYYVMTTGNPTSLEMPDDPSDPRSVPALLDAILDVNPDAVVLLDAVYNRTLPGDGNRRMLACVQDHPARDRVVFVESLSKTHAFTGTRAGVVLTSHRGVATHLRDLGLDAMAGPSNVMQVRAAGVLRPWWDKAATAADRQAGRAFVQGLAAHMRRRRSALLGRILEDPLLRDWFAPLSEQPGLAPHGPNWQGGLYAWLALRPEPVEALRRRRDVLPDERLNPALHLFVETGLACIGGRGFVAPASRADEPGRAAAIAEAARFVRVSVGTTRDEDLGLAVADAC